MVQSSGETIASRLVMKNGLGQVDREITKRHKFLEISPEISRLSHLIANLILPGGIFLTADYGSMDPFRDSISLRAIRRHQILDDPISNIGNADFSADVDFSAIMRQFPIDRFHQRGLVSQGSFLKTMGIMERARMLESVDPLLMKTIERLISPDKMGQIYKVFAATSR